MSIQTFSKPREPVGEPDAHLIAAVQVMLDAGGTINDRALAVAKLGHPVWFARRGEHGGYDLLQPANRGTVFDEPHDQLFTTVESRLQQKLSKVNGLAFRVTGADGHTVTYAWSEVTNCVEPYRVVQRPRGDELAAPTPVAKPALAPAIQPVALIDRELAVDQIRKFDRAIAEFAAQIDSLRNQAVAIRNQADVDLAEIEDLTEARSARAADALREGKDIGDRQPESGPIAKLRLRVDAAERALGANSSDREKAEKKLTLAKEQRVAAIVEWAGAEHTLATADLRAAMQSLVPHLVRVSAIDRAKLSLVGTGKLVTQAPNHPGLTSGEKLVGALVAAFPNALCPDELKPAALSAFTAKAAASLLREVEEG